MRPLALALALALVTPLALASPANVTLMAAEGGAWNGVSEGEGLVWVPPGARVHAVTANGSAAGWTAAGPDALRVAGGGPARVEFDYAPPPLRLARYVAPQDVEISFRVVPPPGVVVRSDALAFREEAGAFVADASLPAGAAVPLRAVDADRVGELPLLVALGALALLALLCAMLWHRLRPVAPRDRPVRFLDHLVELQARLLPPVLVFAFLNMFFFVAGLRVVKLGPVPLVAPTLAQGGSIASRAYDALAERLVPEGVDLVALRPVDAVLAQVEVALFLAFLATLPLLAYEVGAFVAPALHAREKRIVGRVVPVVSALFVAGAAFGLLGMAPLMMRTLYAFAPAVGAAPLLGVGDLVSFALLVVLAFALAFQLPVVMFALSRFVLVKAATWRRYTRHAVVIIFVAAGVLTPDPSVVSQLLVGLPITLLYALGMLAAAWGERTRSRVAGAVMAA